MKKSEIMAALKQIAAREEITVEQVRQEIQEAIDIGMAACNPLVQAAWKSIPCKGDKPTPEEVIVHICRQVQRHEVV